MEEQKFPTWCFSPAEIAVAQLTYVIYLLSLWRKQKDLNCQRHKLSPLFILSVCCKTIVCSNRYWSAGLLGTIYFERDPNSLFVCCTILKEAISGLEICVIKLFNTISCCLVEKKVVWGCYPFDLPCLILSNTYMYHRI